MQHQQSGGFCQRPVLAMQIALQLFVPDFEGAYLGPGLAWIRFSAAAKGLAPLFHLMFTQAFLAAPAMQYSPAQSVAF